MKHQLRNLSGDKHFSLLGCESRDYSFLMHTASNYPFGLVIDDLSYFNQDITNTSANRYLYNGKELQADAELDWYDYGARFYDPQIARFHTTDLFSEAYSFQSPYVYAANNPITYIDYLGMYPRGDYDDYDYDYGWPDWIDGWSTWDNVMGWINRDFLGNTSSGIPLVGSDDEDHDEPDDRLEDYFDDWRDEVDAISGAGLPSNSGDDATLDDYSVYDYLTYEIISVNQDDYMLFNQEWIPLPKEEKITVNYKDPLDISIDGAEYSLNRKQIAISDYINKKAAKNAISITITGGSVISALIKLYTGAWKISPASIPVYIGTYFETIQSIYNRNNEHDKRVLQKRRIKQ